MANGLPTLTNNQAISNVGKQGYDGGGRRVQPARRNHLRTTASSTSPRRRAAADPKRSTGTNSAEGRGGFGRGTGQVWAYHPQRGTPGGRLPVGRAPPICACPTTSPSARRGTLILCEDNPGPNRLQALTKRGDLITFAERSDTPTVEFAGATFDRHGKTLFVNLNAADALSRGDLGSLA